MKRLKNLGATMKLSHLLLALTLSAPMAMATQESCNKSLTAYSNPFKGYENLFNTTILNPKNALPGGKFGYESEFTLDKYSSRLLNIYTPAKQFKISNKAWMAMSRGDQDLRIEWVKSHRDLLFPSLRVPGGLDLTKTAARKLPYLPPHLILDYTGNLEVVLPPFDSSVDWVDASLELMQTIGNGSLQSTVGLPSSIFWNRVAGGNTKNLVGFLKFLAEFDVLLKLELGYEKFLEVPTKAPAAAFSHPFLGPLIADKEQTMIRYINENVNGGLLDKESLDFVSHSDASWKLSGTSVYRPDIAPGWVVFEVRDAHANLTHLQNQMGRLVYFLNTGIIGFDRYSRIQPFDTASTFELLDSKVRELLKAIYPPRFINTNEQYLPEEILTNETFRNFSYPLRDWNQILGSLGLVSTSELKAIADAQETYIRELQNIANNWLDKNISIDQARVQIEASLVRFVHFAKLADKFIATMNKEVTTRARPKLHKANRAS